MRSQIKSKKKGILLKSRVRKKFKGKFLIKIGRKDSSVTKEEKRERMKGELRKGLSFKRVFRKKRRDLKGEENNYYKGQDKNLYKVQENQKDQKNHPS